MSSRGHDMSVHMLVANYTNHGSHELASAVRIVGLKNSEYTTASATCFIRDPCAFGLPERLTLAYMLECLTRQLAESLLSRAIASLSGPSVAMEPTALQWNPEHWSKYGSPIPALNNLQKDLITKLDMEYRVEQR